MRSTILLLWLYLVVTTATANEPEPLIQELLDARDRCSNELHTLKLIGTQTSDTQYERIERCVTEKIGLQRHVFGVVRLRETENPGQRIFFIDVVEEIRERMEHIPNPFK